VQQTPERYDLVIVDLPPPSTSQLNRFFTREFYLEVQHVLTPDGVLSFALGHYENYISHELQLVLACTQRTLRSCFSQVLLLPGSTVFFLASNGPLYQNVAARLEAKGVDTRLVNRHYLDSMFTPDRFVDLRQAALGPAALNRDFSPVLYHYHLRYWMSQFESKLKWLPPVLLCLLALYLLKLRAPAMAILASGFAASTLEMVLLLGIQILCGALYYHLALVVTLFMAGLATGAFWTRHWPLEGGRNSLAKLAFGLAVLAGLLPLVLWLLSCLNRLAFSLVVVQISILTLAFSVACLVGAEFPLAGRLSGGSQTDTAARLYLADLSGACLGALLAAAWLLPLFGLTAVCLLAGGLNLCSGLALLRTKPRL
jgi:spermidine synthase